MKYPYVSPVKVPRPWWQTILIVFGKTVLFIGLFYIVSGVSWKYFDRSFKKPISEFSVSGFPVFVTTSDRSARPEVKYFYTSTLIEIQSQLPNYTFRIIEADGTEMHEYFICNGRGFVKGDVECPDKWRLEVKNIDAERQSFRVALQNYEGASISWYEVSDKDIYPQYFKSYGPGFALLTFVPSIISTLALWFFGKKILAFIIRRRAAARSATGEIAPLT